MRERLIELLNTTLDTAAESGVMVEHIADYLLDNGVIVPQWIPVTPETMPESGVNVWLCCERRRCDGTIYRYVCDGEYIAKHTEIVGSIGDDIAVEYDEETDEFYLSEGFYERINNWDEYSSVVISDYVTHWMPLPQPPRKH